MSTKGIYTALSGAMAQNERLDTIANNLANVNTPAFKKDQQVFKEYLSAYEKPPEVLTVPIIPATTESFYDHQGGDRGYVDASGTYTDFAQGPLKPSGNRLDVALEGTGFVEILTPQGVRFTRSGNFTLDAEGRLVNKNGFPVLMRGAGAPETRILRLNSDQVTFTSNGGIYQEGAAIGELSLVDFANKEAVQKIGNSLYALKDNMNPLRNDTPLLKVHQGFVEGSNVNIVQEMTDMIQATRTFESTQRVMKAYDTMEDHLVNSVPKF